MYKTIRNSFPQTFKDLETDFLIMVYEKGAARIRQAIESLSAEDISARPLPKKWTAKEILAHLLDSEIMGTLRIRSTMAQRASNFIGYDQDIWAKEHNYQSLSEQDLEVILNTFGNLRKFNTSLFRRATAQDWQKLGFHPELGKMSLRNLLELYADHSEKHIGQILSIRQLLGNSLPAIEKMLEKPLFK